MTDKSQTFIAKYLITSCLFVCLFVCCLLKADPDCRVQSSAYVRKIFRGQDFGEVNVTSCYKADWKLVPRADEDKYLNTVKKPLPQTVVPDSIPFPPLLDHFIMLERQQKAESLQERPMLPVKSVLRPKPDILPAS